MENTEYQRIDQARKILDFASFKDFAEKLGVSPQVFYDIKNGKHGISKKLAEKIHALDDRISVPWLLTGDGTTIMADGGNVANNVNGPNSQNSGKVIDVLAHQLDEKDKQIGKLLTIIENLSNH